jgi:DNA polymerase-4
VVRRLVDLVEVGGWDEGFLGTDVDDPERLAHALRRTVEVRTSFTCCVGIGDNKIRAKLATGFAKAVERPLPEDAAGVYRLTRDSWFDVVGARPTTVLWGVGAKTAEKLAAMGVSTVEDLARADVAELRARFGPATGPWLRSLGLGEGSRTISTEPYTPRGHSRAETLREDLVERADVEATLRGLAAEVMDDVGAERMVTQNRNRHPAPASGLTSGFRPSEARGSVRREPAD